ncbi:MAG: hypothetical protein ACRCW0_06050 [Clostridium sp.]
MKKRLISKILMLSLATTLLVPTVALAKTQPTILGPNFPIYLQESGVNDSRATANELPEHNPVAIMHGNVTAGDVDYFKLTPKDEEKGVRFVIETYGHPDAKIDVIDADGNPTPVEYEGKIELDMSKGDEYYIRVTTGMTGDKRYTLVAYSYSK